MNGNESIFVNATFARAFSMYLSISQPVICPVRTLHRQPLRPNNLVGLANLAILTKSAHLHTRGVPAERALILQTTSYPACVWVLLPTGSRTCAPPSSPFAQA